MRNFIDLVSKTPITEAAQDYKAMLLPLMSAIIPTPTDRRDDPSIKVDQFAAEKLTKAWNEQIAAAKSHLKKEDRIVWYLRIARQYFLKSYAKMFDASKIEKLRHEFVRRSGSDVGNLLLPGVLEELTHFLSLPIPSIQQYVFQYQSYDKVISDFKNFEKEWQEALSRMFVDDSSKIIIDFGNDWYWVDTEKASCSKEAGSMGHCHRCLGAVNYHHLLSLRKKHMVGDQVMWEPFLTFILHSNGNLGEMKGRANEKPAERYHPMIVKLLMSDTVKGIDGGGYLPENNFSLDDLSPIEKESILKAKPELGTAYDLLTIDGKVTRRVKVKIETELENLNSRLSDDIEFRDHDMVVVMSWPNVDYMLREMRHYVSFSEYEALNDISEGSYDDRLGWLEFKDAYSVLSALFNEDEMESRETDPEERKVIENTKAKLSTLLGSEEEDLIDALMHVFPRSITELIEHTKNRAKSRAYAYVFNYLRKVEWSVRGVSLSFLTGEVFLKIDAGELVEALESYREGEDEYNLHSITTDGDWATLAELYDDQWDNDGEEDSVEHFYTDILTFFLNELIDLFKTEDQLSFDF